MQINTRFQPFHADTQYEADDQYSISVSLFDVEIFRTKPFDGYPDEYTLDNFAEVAQDILGDLIAERLAIRVRYGVFGGIPSID